MNCLKNICGRIETVEKKLSGIEQLEKKMDSFERELKGLWVTIDDRSKREEDRALSLED